MPTIRNIIYIHTHDMGRYISPYGHAIPTPNLQQFAESATLFRQAHCCGPTCSPSRAGLLTGVSPHECGMLGLAHRGFVFSHPEYHLGAYLKEQGFLTALCGMQHEFDSAWEQMPYEFVFKKPSPEGKAATDRSWTRAAVDFLHQPHARPFFLSFGLFYPHRPFEPSTINPDSIKVPDPLPDLPEIRRDMADYLQTVKLADDCIGQVLNALRETGRDKDSVIIVTTDHGIAFPHMKCNLTAHGTGVTLIMQFPGNPSAGMACDALVSHLDVFPTLCDLLDLNPPQHLQGHSMRPLFEGTADEIRTDLFSEVSFHAAAEPMRAIRTRDFNLIQVFDNQPPRPLSNIDNGRSKTELLKKHQLAEPRDSIQLYDLTADPSEHCNVAAQPHYAGIAKELSGRLHQWMESTSDPLLQGPLQPPPGATVNTPDSVDANQGPFLQNQ